MKVFELASATLALPDSKIVEHKLSRSQIIKLAISQYVDPLAAGVREVIINAADSHIRAGKWTEPIEVTYTNNVDSTGVTLVVKDRGDGMDEKFLSNNYFSLGDSSSKGDTALSGGFGLGSKALLASADLIKVSSCKDNIRTTVLAQLVDESIHVTTVSVEVDMSGDGTEFTAVLLSTSFNQVSDIVHKVGCFIGIGSRYKGRLVVNKSDDQPAVVGHVKNFIDHCEACSVDSKLLIDKTYAYRAYKRSESYDEENRLLKLATAQPLVIWNNARYAVPTELDNKVAKLCGWSDLQIGNAGRGNNLFKRLCDIDFYCIFDEHDEQLNITTDRNELMVTDDNARILSNKLQQAVSKFQSRLGQWLDDLKCECGNADCVTKTHERWKAAYVAVKALLRNFVGMWASVDWARAVTFTDMSCIPAMEELSELDIGRSGIVWSACSSSVEDISGSAAFAYYFSKVGNKKARHIKIYSSDWTRQKRRQVRDSRNVKDIGTRVREMDRETGASELPLIIVGAIGCSGNFQSINGLVEYLLGDKKAVSALTIGVLPQQVDKAADRVRQMLAKCKLPIKVKTVAELDAAASLDVNNKSPIVRAAAKMNERFYLYNGAASGDMFCRIDDLTDHDMVQVVENKHRGYVKHTESGRLPVIVFERNGKTAIIGDGCEVNPKMLVVWCRTAGITAIFAGKKADLSKVNSLFDVKGITDVKHGLLEVTGAIRRHRLSDTISAVSCASGVNEHLSQVFNFKEKSAEYIFCKLTKTRPSAFKIFKLRKLARKTSVEPTLEKRAKFIYMHFDEEILTAIFGSKIVAAAWYKRAYKDGAAVEYVKQWYDQLWGITSGITRCLAGSDADSRVKSALRKRFMTELANLIKGM